MFVFGNISFIQKFVIGGIGDKFANSIEVLDAGRGIWREFSESSA